MVKNIYPPKGFSLIEIMIVVIIIGLMLAVAVPVYIDHKYEAEDSKIRQDFATIYTALSTYEINNYKMPSTDQGLEALVRKTDIDPIPRKWPSRGYLQRLPLDPWGQAYHYIYQGDGQFELFTYGLDGQPGGQGRDADQHYHDQPL